MVPEGYRFTKDHEWIKVEGTKGRVGLANYAQDQLGDIVFVELPSVGAQINKGDVFGVVESVKAASDCYCPANGTVTAVNDSLGDEPGLINSDPHGDGWIFEIELSDTSELDALMDKAQYEKYLEEVAH